MAVDYSDDLEEIKRRKLEEYRRQLEEQRRLQEQKRAEEARRQELLRKILTREARERLSNLKLVKPELAESIEVQLIQLASSGRVPLPIDDATLKKLLSALAASRREVKIKFFRPP